MVLGNVLISFFYTKLSSSPSTTPEEAIFSALYILVSFVKDKVSIGAWIYLFSIYLAFYLVSLIYISVFVPVPHYLEKEEWNWRNQPA